MKNQNDVKIFRFLSRRGNKSNNNSNNTNSQPTASHKPSLNQQNTNFNLNFNKHVKLNVCEDLKESIEHYNQRCLEIKKLKEKQELEKLNQDLIIQNNNNSGGFLNFKSFKNKTSSVCVQNNNQSIPKDSIECAIVFLDDTQESFYLPKKALASKLYEQVYYHLDLIETDYFGLQFSDTHNVKHWLDPTKPIKKQCKIGPPYQFFLKLNFTPPSRTI